MKYFGYRLTLEIIVKGEGVLAWKNNLEVTVDLTSWAGPEAPDVAAMPIFEL